jgi:CBS domain-containing protein
MVSVADIIADKGSAVFAVRPNATVFEAIDTMVRRNVGALVVVEDGVLIGMVTERDYLRRIALEGRTSKATFVEQIMSTSPVTVAPSTSVDDCMRIMTENRIRHLPVLVGDRLVGLVSIGDIVKWMLRDQAVHIEYLTEYIQGRV